MMVMIGHCQIPSYGTEINVAGSCWQNALYSEAQIFSTTEEKL